MTVPAFAGAPDAAHRVTGSTGPTPALGWDLSAAIARAARLEDLADGPFRFYTIVVTTFHNGAFTGAQAAAAADVPIKTAWQYLGMLAKADLFTSRRAVVGENQHGNPRRERIYRAKAVA